MLNLIWLRTFCTLADTGHFTRTAEKLSMCQSAVTQHVQKLEQHYGQLLLDRRGKQFSLTDAGMRVVTRGQQLLADAAVLELELGEDPPYAGTVKLASPGSVGLRLYPALLDWQTLHRKLIIDYRFAPNDSVEREVTERNVDLGLMTRNTDQPELISTKLGEEQLLLVTPSTVTEPSWENLLPLGFIGHPDGAHHAALLLRANYSQFEHVDQCSHSGFSNQIGLMLEPVSRGLGFTVLPAYAVEAFSRPESICVHALENPVCEPLYLIRRRYQHLPRRIHNVIERISQLL